ncbi:iota-carrageenase [Zobellia galactanivorans]|uniref:Iota-carrageenase A3 n=1 Tax=Zobellia galactanivorans (strain DSM 12802 / CCUG 47099 / CIP 106680 / NCIMB 13871 / Dsij) TaxID=63186 RepID=D9UAT2_ZOBGA|nr:iota-carrageenase [Zobellia galactanivorans]CAZ96032.1 Iota-carrageenase, family GH82 [Zobellia galactanivorans]CBW46642.1 Iota-carrageenase A3 [Zobellia galactanivorans]
MAAIINATFLLAQSGAPITRPVDLNENNFFSDTSGSIPASRRKTLANNGPGDDSGTLNQLITTLADQGGGVITIPAGTWLLGAIKLKSNIHLVFDQGAIVKPKLGNFTDHSIFEIGYTGVKVSNVSIRSNTNKFKIDMSELPYNTRILPFNIKETENFMISGCHVIDKWTVHSTVNLGLSKRNGVWAGSKNGLVKNISVINAHGGYGAVQTRVAHKVFFKNISSQGGGATLRIETDGRETSGNQAPQNIARVSEISAYNISCKNGNSAVMIQPWGAKNGWFDIQKVRATSCMAAVRIDRAFVDLNAPSIGNFDPDSRITDIASTYGTNA